MRVHNSCIELEGQKRTFYLIARGNDIPWLDKVERAGSQGEWRGRYARTRTRTLIHTHTHTDPQTHTGPYTTVHACTMPVLQLLEIRQHAREQRRTTIDGSDACALQTTSLLASTCPKPLPHKHTHTHTYTNAQNVNRCTGADADLMDSALHFGWVTKMGLRVCWCACLLTAS